VRGRHRVDAGRNAAGAVLFDHGAADRRDHGQGAESFALLQLSVLQIERNGRRPVEPVVRGGRHRFVFQRMSARHRWRLVAHRGRHVRQHNTIRRHSPTTIPPTRPPSDCCQPAAIRRINSLQQAQLNKLLLFCFYISISYIPMG